MQEQVAFLVGVVLGVAMILTLLVLFDKISDQFTLNTIRNDQTNLVNQLNKVLQVTTVQSESMMIVMDSIRSDIRRLKLAQSIQVVDEDCDSVIEHQADEPQENDSVDEEEEQVRQEALKTVTCGTKRDNSEERTVKFLDEVTEEDINSRSSDINHQSDESHLIGTRIEYDDTVNQETVTKSELSVKEALTTLTNVVENPNRGTTAKLFQQIRSMLSEMPVGNRLTTIVDKLENGAMKGFDRTEDSISSESEPVQSSISSVQNSVTDHVDEAISEEEKLQLQTLKNEIERLTEMNSIETSS